MIPLQYFLKLYLKICIEFKSVCIPSCCFIYNMEILYNFIHKITVLYTLCICCNSSLYCISNIVYHACINYELCIPGVPKLSWPRPKSRSWKMRRPKLKDVATKQKRQRSTHCGLIVPRSEIEVNSTVKKASL